MKRYMWTGAFFMTFFSGSYFVILYYLPIYFQSVYDTSPIGSGVRMLALIIPLTFAAIAQGFLFTKIGITPLFWMVGGALGTIGCGLMYTMNETTSTGKWIGYQIIVGFAVGLTTQVALQNAQVQVSPEDLSQATAVINCKSVQNSSSHNRDLTTRFSLPDRRRILFHLSGTIGLQQPTHQVPLRPPSGG